MHRPQIHLASYFAAVVAYCPFIDGRLFSARKSSGRLHLVLWNPILKPEPSRPIASFTSQIRLRTVLKDSVGKD